MSKILVVGSLGYDSIATPCGKVENVLGGSANYFSLAASLYSGVRLVGVVGTDYRQEDRKLLEARGVELDGLQVSEGATFRWSGRYEAAMNEAITLKTELNVFQNFSPIIPESFRNTPLVFLGNIHPALQMDVLGQVEAPVVVGLDTMNFWISSEQGTLLKAIEQVDVLVVNEGEAKALADTPNTIRAVETLAKIGPRAIVVKRGEYGFVLYFQGKYFVLPAFPVPEVVDPTGAGDSFAGGFFGYLSQLMQTSKYTSKDQLLTMENLKRACLHGTVVASFTVQDFSTGALQSLTTAGIDQRLSHYHSVVAV